MILKLYNGSNVISVYLDTIAFNYQGLSLNNPTEIKNSYGQDIKMPKNSQNMTFFNNIGLFSGDYTILNNNKNRFELYNSSLVESGYYYLTTIDNDNYTIKLFGLIGEIFSSLIEDIDDNGINQSLLTYLPIDIPETYITKDLIYDQWLNNNTINTTITDYTNYPNQITAPLGIFAPSYQGLYLLFDSSSGYTHVYYDYITGNLLNHLYLGNSEIDTNYNSKDIVSREDDNITENTLNHRWKYNNKWFNYAGDYRSYYQRPLIYVQTILSKILDKIAAKNININLDSDFFSAANPYWNNLFVLLPNMVITDDYEKVESEEPYGFYGASKSSNYNQATTLVFDYMMMRNFSSGSNFVNTTSINGEAARIKVSGILLSIGITDYQKNFINPDGSNISYSFGKFIISSYDNNNTMIDRLEIYLLVDLSTVDWTLTNNQVNIPDIVIDTPRGTYSVDMTYQPSYIPNELFGSNSGDYITINTPYDPFLPLNSLYLPNAVPHPLFANGLNFILNYDFLLYKITYVVANNGVRSGSLIDWLKMCNSEVTCYNFLKSYCLLFNLKIYYDLFLNTLNILTPSKFYTGLFINLTDKIDRPSVLMNYNIFDYHKILIGLKHSNNMVEELYFSRVNLNYADGIIYTSNNQNKNEIKLFEDNIFYQTIIASGWGALYRGRNPDNNIMDDKVMVYNQTSGHGIDSATMQLCFYDKLNSDRVNSFLITDDDPYLKVNGYCWYNFSGVDENGNTTSNYYYADYARPCSKIPHITTNIIDSPEFSLNVFQPALTYSPNTSAEGTIYYKFWKSYLDDLYNPNTHIVKAKVYLKNWWDIYMRNFYIIDSSIYVMIKVSNYKYQDDLYDCELLKVNDINNYTTLPEINLQLFTISEAAGPILRFPDENPINGNIKNGVFTKYPLNQSNPVIPWLITPSNYTIDSSLANGLRYTIDTSSPSNLLLIFTGGYTSSIKGRINVVNGVNTVGIDVMIGNMIPTTFILTQLGGTSSNNWLAYNGYSVEENTTIDYAYENQMTLTYSNDPSFTFYGFNVTIDGNTSFYPEQTTYNLPAFTMDNQEIIIEAIWYNPSLFTLVPALCSSNIEAIGGSYSNAGGNWILENNKLWRITNDNPAFSWYYNSTTGDRYNLLTISAEEISLWSCIFNSLYYYSNQEDAPYISTIDWVDASGNSLLSAPITMPSDNRVYLSTTSSSFTGFPGTMLILRRCSLSDSYTPLSHPNFQDSITPLYYIPVTSSISSNQPYQSKVPVYNDGRKGIVVGTVRATYLVASIYNNFSDVVNNISNPSAVQYWQPNSNDFIWYGLPGTLFPYLYWTTNLSSPSAYQLFDITNYDYFTNAELLLVPICNPTGNYIVEMNSPAFDMILDIPEFTVGIVSAGTVNGTASLVIVSDLQVYFGRGVYEFTVDTTKIIGNCYFTIIYLDGSSLVWDVPRINRLMQVGYNIIPYSDTLQYGTGYPNYNIGPTGSLFNASDGSTLTASVTSGTAALYPTSNGMIVNDNGTVYNAIRLYNKVIQSYPSGSGWYYIRLKLSDWFVIDITNSDMTNAPFNNVPSPWSHRYESFTINHTTENTVVTRNNKLYLLFRNGNSIIDRLIYPNGNTINNIIELSFNLPELTGNVVSITLLNTYLLTNYSIYYYNPNGKTIRILYGAYSTTTSLVNSSFLTDLLVSASVDGVLQNFLVGPSWNSSTNSGKISLLNIS